MTLWLVFSLMTAVAILAVLWPLSRRTAAPAGSALAVYRDQLDEVERDRVAGRIADAEAQAARIEVSRRLLAADAAATGRAIAPERATFQRRAAAVIGLAAVPLVAGSLYLALGSPQLPGQPALARNDGAPEQRSLASLVSQAEAHIERSPNDGRGWEVLAPVYLRMGRFDDAVKARRNALTLNGETAERQADLGEALAAAANGIVTADAKAAFERALVLDGKHPKARFYAGLGLQQDGQRASAAQTWQALLADAPPDVPWAASVRQALAEMNVPAVAAQSSSPGPTADDMAAAAKMNEGERGEMVRGMVTRLAARMKDDPTDIEGWFRLIRAYVVLGEREQARAAAADAQRAFANDADRRRRIEDLVKGLGLEG